MCMTDRPLALVTGAAHRLGKVFATSLAQQGFAVLLHYYSGKADAEQTAQEIHSAGAPAFVMSADLRAPSEIEALFAFADTLPHQLKVLVNSAALMTRADASSLSADEWDAVFDLNLRAPFFCAQHAAGRMRDGGLIVNVTDVAASKAWPAYPSYSISKAGLESMTMVLARAFAPRVRVNAIAPGLVLHSDIVSQDRWDTLVDRLPLKRPAEMSEIAAALEFLVKNEYVTGQTIVVDGGYSLV